MLLNAEVSSRLTRTVRWSLLLVSCALILLGPQRAAAENPPGFVAKWGTYGTAPGEFRGSSGIAVDPFGNVYVCDAVNNRIQKFDNNGTFLLQWGSPGSGPGQFYSPMNIASDDQGALYVADTGNLRIQKFDAEGDWLDTMPIGTFYAFHLDVDPAGTFVAIIGSLIGIKSLATDGAVIASWTTTNPSVLSTTGGVAIGGDGRIYVSVTGFSRIEEFAKEGNYLGQVPITGPTSIDLDASDNIYVASDNAVVKLTNAGAVVWQFGSSGTGDGQFSVIDDLAVDRDGNIFTVESAANRVQKFSKDTTPAHTVSWGAVKAKYR